MKSLEDIRIDLYNLIGDLEDYANNEGKDKTCPDDDFKVKRGDHLEWYNDNTEENEEYVVAEDPSDDTCLFLLCIADGIAFTDLSSLMDEDGTVLLRELLRNTESYISDWTLLDE